MKKPIKFLVIPILLVGFVYAVVQHNAKNNSTEINVSIREYVLGNFLSELPAINSKLPFKVDDLTTLNSIEYIDGKIASRYTVMDSSLLDPSNSQSIMRIASKLSAQLCSDQTRRSLLDLEIEFLNKYQDKQGVSTFELLINKKTCLK